MFINYHAQAQNTISNFPVSFMTQSRYRGSNQHCCKVNSFLAATIVTLLLIIELCILFQGKENSQLFGSWHYRGSDIFTIPSYLGSYICFLARYKVVIAIKDRYF